MLPIKKYNVIIDNHNNLERLSPYFDDTIIKIYHATNAHWLYQNSVEYARSHQFFLKTGMSISPLRQISPGNSALFCNAISFFGNEFTQSTFGRFASKGVQLPMSVTTNPEIILGRDYGKAKSKFIWLNSHGALLKGLDVVIDAFRRLPHLELHICCNIQHDAVFFDAMNLQACSNIFLEGWVDIHSDKFLTLAENCAWIICTSFSEGGGGSTLNCMGKGLIPVLSRASSISLPKNTGFYLEENNSETLFSLLNEISMLEEVDLEMMSQASYRFIMANHTVQNFKLNYKKFLSLLLTNT
jgi:glycosyltransferase involved in cell wall biosynthesis